MIHRHLHVAIAITILSGSMLALPATTHAAEESDFHALGGITLQDKQMDFKLLGVVPIDGSVMSANLTLGGIWRGIYLIVEADRPFSQEISYLPGTTPVQLALQREDESATMGFNPWRSLNLFAGYKRGQTELTTFPAGGSTELLEFVFDESGPFAGASYSFDFASGQLMLSLAYADLPTSVTRTVLRDSTAETTHGNTSGLSYGFKWTGNLAESLDYQIGIKTTNYEFDDADLVIDAGKDMSTDQTYRIFFVGLSKVF
jgi:hypothetical protein